MAKQPNDPEGYKIRRAFARRLQAARVAAGFETAKALAVKIGAHPMTYGRWERAETEPGLHTLVKIRREVKKSLDFLILGDNS